MKIIIIFRIIIIIVFIISILHYYYYCDAGGNGNALILRVFTYIILMSRSASHYRFNLFSNVLSRTQNRDQFSRLPLLSDFIFREVSVCRNTVFVGGSCRGTDPIRRRFTSVHFHVCVAVISVVQHGCGLKNVIYLFIYKRVRTL